MPSARTQYAMAASLVALAVAVPAIVQMLGDFGVTQLSGELPADIGGELKKAEAAKGEQKSRERLNQEAATDPAGSQQIQTYAVGRDGTMSGGTRPTAAAAPAAPKIAAGPNEPSGGPGTPCCADAEERIAELEATTSRKGNRKVEIAVEAGDGSRVALNGTALVPGKPAAPPAAAKIAQADTRSQPALRMAEADSMSGRAEIGQLAMNAPQDRAPDPMPAQVEENRDKHNAFEDNGVKQVASEPVSTFSLDVDTASYSFGRRVLNAGRLPQKNAVRVEEMINYFPYAYPASESADVPFQPQVSIFPAPWNAAHKLVHIGIKGYTLPSAERPRANLVFLIDTSGSMSPADRLPLVKNAFRMLLDQLRPDDTVGIVTYAGNTSVALRPTKAANRAEIIAAIDRLGAGGSTAGAQGIQDAYALAEANFDAGGVNRIILATDGDFNVGITDQNELKSFVERKRDRGIFLSILGVGIGNHNDAMMQTLAQNGNGVAAYIDTLSEARKVLVEEASSSLFTIAKDVKIQVEFNPAAVSEYRLIGYETRALKREDFNNDKVDAGDAGSGHTVTAIYEITPAGGEGASFDPLRYGAKAESRARIEPAAEFGFLKMRYKLPKDEASKLLTLPISTALEKRTIAEVSTEARFSVAVAGFGQLLRGSPHLKAFGYDDVIALAQSSKGDDAFGYRAEFINLARLAKTARP